MIRFTILPDGTLVVPWAAVREFLGRDHDGSIADDCAVLRGLAEADAPYQYADSYTEDDRFLCASGWCLRAPKDAGEDEDERF